MQDSFRQRLVGAIVLICLSVILWPVVFSDKNNPAIDRSSHISPMPEFEKFTVKASPAPQYVPIKRYEPEQEEHSTENSPETINKAIQPEVSRIVEQQAQSSVQGLPVYWALQVASFSQKDKADKLKQQLIALGHKVELRTVHRAGNTVIRVYIGPKLDKNSLESIQQEIDKQFAVKSILLRFTPQ